MEEHLGSRTVSSNDPMQPPLKRNYSMMEQMNYHMDHMDPSSLGQKHGDNPSSSTNENVASSSPGSSIMHGGESGMFI